MTDISENFSESRRRGRPPRHGPEVMTMMRGLFPEARTVRSIQNKWFLVQAQRVLRHEPELTWLLDLDPSTHAIQKGGAYRMTILQELRRIEDEGVMKAVARRLCELKPSTREAVAMIRRFRLGRSAPASVNQLVDALAQTIDDYRMRHPQITDAQIHEALQMVGVLVRQAEADQA
jgi:hypothetical protein